jgi:predicted transcriptional regulator of viral defense system
MKTYEMDSISKKIYDSSIQLFTLATLASLLDIHKSSTFFKIIKRLVKNGLLIKIERGKYVLKKNNQSQFSLANFIYEPSYVSFESALNYGGILSQFPYEVTSATVKQTKRKEFNNVQYSYYKLKKELFWGYKKEDNYLVANREKALLDQIYLCSKGIKKINLDEYNFSVVNRNRLKAYLPKFPKTRQFTKVAKQLIEKLKI